MQILTIVFIEIAVFVLVFLVATRTTNARAIFVKMIPQLAGVILTSVGIERHITWLIYVGSLIIIADVIYVIVTNLTFKFKKNKKLSAINKIYLISLAPLLAVGQIRTLAVWLPLMYVLLSTKFGPYLMLLSMLDIIIYSAVISLKMLLSDTKFTSLGDDTKQNKPVQTSLRIAYTAASLLLLILVGYSFWNFISVI